MKSSRPLRTGRFIAAVLCLLVACTNASEPPIARSAAAATAVPTVPTVVTPSATPLPTVDPTPTDLVQRPELPPIPAVSAAVADAAREVERAPLGTFVVAKPDAGVPVVIPPWSDGRTTLEIPVFDEPYGEPRALIYHRLSEVQERLPLLNSDDDGPPLVLRVLAGGPADDWIQVQAPTRPHGNSVWVNSEYFDFGFTQKRIEIDLAGPGELRLVDGGDIVLISGIVQGRPAGPTPTHVTYVEAGATGGYPAAFGRARLSIASFSETLDEFSTSRLVDGAPKNWLHGGNHPELIGQAVSLGEVRVPNDVIETLVDQVTPGTPVVIFNSSSETRSAQALLTRDLLPAPTVDFADTALRVTPAVDRVDPQIWHRCPTRSGVFCRVGESSPSIPAPLVTIGSTYLVAKPEAGDLIPGLKLQVGSGEPRWMGAWGWEGRVVPVFDAPGGERRNLVYENTVESWEWGYPLLHPTVFDEPLVLRIVRGAPGDDWFLVQAPVRPQRQSVWVRASDFDFAQTLKRLEIDIAGDGIVRFYDGYDEVLSNPIVSGRGSRPTTLADTYVEQLIVGETLSPAYGTWVLSLALFSNVLGSYGGGGLPAQSFHGTNQPELMGQRVSSGGIRVPNEIVSFIAEQPGILGARVTLYDSSVSSLEAQQSAPWTSAKTTTFLNSPLPFVGIPSYS